MGDKYRKQMKRGGYSKLLYNQRNKNETIRFSDKTTVWGAHYIKIRRHRIENYYHSDA